jgi:hypothetical protein
MKHGWNPLDACDNFLAQNANWLFHEKRSADCAINTAAFLARLLVMVRVEVIQGGVHYGLVQVHRAADREFSLTRNEE